MEFCRCCDFSLFSHLFSLSAFYYAFACVSIPSLCRLPLSYPLHSTPSYLSSSLLIVVSATLLVPLSYRTAAPVKLCARSVSVALRECRRGKPETKRRGLKKGREKRRGISCRRRSERGRYRKGEGCVFMIGRGREGDAIQTESARREEQERRRNNELLKSTTTMED